MKLIENRNPATGEKLCEFQYERSSEVEIKLHRAFEAWQKHRALPMGDQIKDRKRSLESLKSNLIFNKQKLARLITLEMGKPFTQSLNEVEKCILSCDYFIENLESFLIEETLKTQGRETFVSRDSMGLVFAIMPWNFPLWQVFRAWISASLGGNAFILKHSDLVYQSALALTQVFQESLTNPNLFQNLTINHEQARRVISDSRIRAVTFTGSEAGGREVAKSCGENLKKVVLELGGSDPYIVFEDADIQLAANACALSRNLNNGQSCIAAKRFIIHKNVEAKFIELYDIEIKKLKNNNPLNLDCQRGPLANLKFKDALKKQIETLLSFQSVKVAGSGEESLPEAFVESQLFRLDLKSTAAKDFFERTEIFGPVAMFVSFQKDEEALELANSSVFGLGAALFSNNVEKIKLLSRKLECGLVGINQMAESSPKAPFGGVKNSGFGRELSHLGINEFTSFKTINLS